MASWRRIPGLAPLAALIASTFSLRSNQTLRRYNDLLAQAFYHHGRLCASNQATVMVLVILFVGMISYPGIVTYYNVSTYARRQAAPTSIDIALSVNKRFGDLDALLSSTVIAPTWTQDPDVFERRLTSSKPMHYLAPVIINATELLRSQQWLQHQQTHTSGSSSTVARCPSTLTETDVLIYAADIQRRIESIEVNYRHQDNDGASTSGTLQGGSVSAIGRPDEARPLTLKDICVEDVSKRTQGSETPCLVHSPLTYWLDDPELIHHDNDLHSTILGLQNSSAHPGLFGRIEFEQGIQPQQFGQHSALVLTFFLKGDLGLDTKSAAPGKSVDSELPKTLPINVLHAWDMILSKLRAELLVGTDQGPSSADVAGKSDSTASSEHGTGWKSGINDPAADGPLCETHPLRLGAKVQELPAAEKHRVSARLVPEEYAIPNTNISAEYWLLAMAYFVMFLYISLSVGRVDLVKSKYGLGIAAVATVFVSLLMSIGLCSVFGVTLTLMPWEILPFMIIVVGVENINILVHSVVETSMDLPVKERVGRGLGAVGVSITRTLVAELGLLIVGAMTTIPAVQEFCTFAIAAVIMDYLLQMTFFITVISIDIRRLELSDLSARPATHFSRHPFGHGHRHNFLSKASPTLGRDSPTFHVGEGSHGHNGFMKTKQHQRSPSTTSQQSDGESKTIGKSPAHNPKGRFFTSILIVGVMAYLGYIYGTTSQSTPSDSRNAVISYWSILSSSESSSFWSSVDPTKTGGFLSIQLPIVISLKGYTSDQQEESCHEVAESLSEEGCNDQDSPELANARQETTKTPSEGQLDPRGPFKLLRSASIFIWLFAFWLIRVFVVPSIILAAAILLLLSYLLSPQRKLLVDLQWRFPFIVLPGDYQSNRKLMMEELMAQEAEELGHKTRPSNPLPGSVETFKTGGHETDIDQMDSCPDTGLILTSSMEGVILLWDGSITNGSQVPIAKLVDERRSSPASSKKGQIATKGSPYSKSIRCLKLERSGMFAVAGYGDGTIRCWKIDHLRRALEYEQHGMALVRCQTPFQQFARSLEPATDPSKLRITAACFWNMSTCHDLSSQSLLIGYRDGQIWLWNILTGVGNCVIDSMHRGGISELSLFEQDSRPRSEVEEALSRLHLVVAGKDGGLQCWVSTQSSPECTAWTKLWGHAGSKSDSAVSVLSSHPEVPMVAAGYMNGAIKVWDLECGNLIWTLSRGTHDSSKVEASLSNNHLPSHRGQVTKLLFHALELEDSLTGDPAPRLWLVVSSGIDETVMIWNVEWEGLMSLPQSGTLSLDNYNIVGSKYRTGVTTPYTPNESLSASSSYFEQMTLELRPGSSIGNGQTDMFLGGRSNSGQLPADQHRTMLSTSLPAPRLVGYMKQKGGKSITVANGCLYGVRRAESISPAASLPSVDGASMLSRSTISDAAGRNGAYGVSSPILRNRRKSDGHALNVQTGSQENGSIHVGASHPSKRGWELWEADLYQCIFRDPGFWGLDLSVRAIDLQATTQHSTQPTPSPQQFPHQFMTRRPSAIQAKVERPAPLQMNESYRENTGSGECEMVMVNSNGSGIAVPVPMDRNRSSHHNRQPSNGMMTGGNFERRAPSEQIAAGGSTGEYGSHLVPPTITLSQSPPAQNDKLEPANEPELLPFVESRLVQTIWRGSGDAYDHSNLMDIVIGFGNWIKVVRLQSEEGDEDT